MILLLAQPSRPKAMSMPQDPQKEVGGAYRFGRSKSPLVDRGRLHGGSFALTSVVAHCTSNGRLIENIGYFGFVLPKSRYLYL
jgi:hypothetical protein